MTWIMVLFLLIAFHAICDYALQGETVAINKNPLSDTPLQKKVPWYYWLVAHALQHGAAVAIITQSVWLGILETIAHFVIDYAKCLGKYNIHVDQLLHLICKIIWVVIMFY